MSPARWILVAVSFAAAIAASGYVVWSTWPAQGGTVTLPLLAHAFGAGAFLLELLSRAWKIQLSARALRIPLAFGTALRTCLGGDFGAAVTPARSGAEPARFLVLTEARVPAAGRLLILFTELFLEMLSLAGVALALAIVFHGTGGALAGLEGLVGGYAVFVLGIGGVGLLLAKRNAAGPPPRWAAWLGVGRWRSIQRSVRQLRSSVDAVRGARLGTMTLAFLASVVHIVARVLVLPGLVYGTALAGGPAVPFTRDAVAPLVLWPLALSYGAAVAPAPGGGGVVEAAFAATLAGTIPAAIFGASLIWWRVYTFYAYVLLGGVATGRTAVRALRRRGRRRAAAGVPAPDLPTQELPAPDGITSAPAVVPATASGASTTQT